MVGFLLIKAIEGFLEEGVFAGQSEGWTGVTYVEMKGRTLKREESYV